MQNLFPWRVMIADMKSISLKQGVDDVINQILHTSPPFFLSAVIHPAGPSPFFLFCANGFPVEGSTWISQTIYPKLQENWLQILERRQKKEEKKRMKLR